MIDDEELNKVSYSFLQALHFEKLHKEHRILLIYFGPWAAVLRMKKLQRKYFTSCFIGKFRKDVEIILVLVFVNSISSQWTFCIIFKY